MSESILPYHAVGLQGSTKDKLLQIAAQQFTEKGYHSTSLEEIANLCEIQKGSLFHHFTSKEVLAVDLINMIRLDCETHIFEAIYSYDRDDNKRITDFNKKLEKFLLARPDCSLPVYMSNNFVDKDCVVLQEIKVYINAWLAALQHFYGLLYDKKASAKTAQQVFAMIHNAQFMHRLFEKPHYVKDVCAEIKIL